MTKIDNAPKISVVVPVYKEEDGIIPFLKRLEPVLEKIGDYEIIFCIDPSPDKTEEIIQLQAQRNSRIKGFIFSRRFGQPASTMAGILNCRGEACVVIDVDLQDPPELIASLYDKLNEGYEVVYAKRRSREGETLPKLWVAWLGYKIIDKAGDVKIPRDTGDFRIMTRRIIEELRNLPESHGFLRGLVAFVGFKQTHVEYDREKRSCGRGNYNPFLGSIKIGLNGLVGFSDVLLSFICVAGLVVGAGGLLAIIYMVVSHDLSLLLPGLVLFIGGVQLIAVGILGQYIGRIYDEVRRRPVYIVDKRINI